MATVLKLVEGGTTTDLNDQTDTFLKTRGRLYAQDWKDER